MRRLLNIVVILLFSSVISGCVETRPDEETVQHFVDQPTFQKENLPIRTVRIAIIADDAYYEESVRDAFTTASMHLEKQVGLKLTIVYFRHEHFTSKNKDAVFPFLWQLETERSDYDIGIALVKLGNGEECVEADGHDCVQGITQEWKDIYLVSPHPDMIVHEIGHVFIHSLDHARVGVMAFPITGSYFTMGDRSTILRNKWRSIRANK